MKRQVKKFERKLNPDTATAEKIQQTNSELFKYLQKKGEKDAAKQVEYLMQNQASGDEHTEAKKNPVYDKLLVTNNKILEVLSKIQRDMIDEQDTSIKSVAKAEPKPKQIIQETGGGSGAAAIAAEAEDTGPGLLDLLDLPDRKGKKTPEKSGKGGKREGAGRKPGKTPGKPGGKAPIPKTSKIPGAGKGAGKAAGKLGGKLGGKMATKVGGKIAGKALAGALKFAGPVGALVAAGMTVYDAYQGWNKAGENLGLEQGKEASLTNKASSAAGEAVSGLTFGLLDAGDTSKGINNMFGGNDTIQKYEKAGIIEHHSIGSSAVKDWTALGQLEPKEIQKIIDIDDWREPDLDRMKKIKEANENAVAAKSQKAAQDVRTAADDIRSRLSPEQIKWLGDQDPTDPQVMARLKAAVPDKPSSGSKNNASEGGSKTTTTTTGSKSTGGSTSGGQQSGAGAGRGNGSKALAPGAVAAVSGDEEVKAMIKRHEGVRNRPYKDSLGLWTVGVGHLIGDGKSLPPEYDRTFSDDEINTMFEEDYAAHKAAAEQIPGFNNLNPTGQGALTDLTFNMGGKWYKRWPKFTKNISEGNTEEAAKSLEDSKWYGQVGNRAPEIVSMIRAGAGDENSAEAKAAKNEASGVAPKKTSDTQVALNTDKSGKAGGESPSPESNKTPKESVVNQSNNNLKNQTVAYDTGTQAKAMNVAIAPVVNQSINSSKQKENVGQDRLLNLFT